jgi:hypothetical protein
VRAAVSRFPETAVGRYSGSGAHLAGCGAALLALAACVAFQLSRPVIVLAAAAAYTAVATATALWWLSRVPAPGSTRSVSELPKFMYLDDRRVSDLLTLLGQSLDGEVTYTDGATISGGLEVKTDVLGVGLSRDRRRVIQREFRNTGQWNDLERYLKLHDYLSIHPAPDIASATRQERTFWEFMLHDVRHVADPDANEAHAIGWLPNPPLPVSFRIAREWCRDPQPFQNLQGTLIIVAKAEADALPEALATQLGVADTPPDWRLRPLAIYR